MKITDQTLDKALDLALNGLRKNLEAPGENSAGMVSKTEILLKAQVAFREGKISLLESGNLENRINKGLSLKTEHMAILGLKPGDKIEGLREPTNSNVSSRMGGSAGKLAMETGAPSPGGNSIIESMAAGQRMTHNFQSADGTVHVVSGAEILRRCQVLVKKGMLTLTRAADLERLINSGLPIRPGVLREIFEV